MTTIDDVVIILDGDKDRKTVYNCKGKTGVCIPDEWNDFTTNALKGVSAKGNTLYVTINMCVGQDDQEHDIFRDVKLTFKNYEDIKDVWCLKEAKKTPNFPDDYQTIPGYYDYIVGKLKVENDNKGTIIGSNFDDKVDFDGTGKDKVYTISTANGADKVTITNTYIDQKNSKKVTTVKAGIGKNDVTVLGTGRNLVTAGKDNDTITFNEGSSTTTVKAGAGENDIKITNKDFGNITLAEEKVKATNKITFTQDISNYDFKKIGASNDLIISNGEAAESVLTIKDYFTTGKKYAKNVINNKATFDELLASGIHYTVTGNGKIKGTNYGEKVVGSDNDDKIYAGKGSDTIDAGKGKNFIYMYKGDGADTISNSSADGNDILVFKKGSKVKMGFVETDENNIYDLRIYYGSNKSDYALLKGVIEYDSVEKTYHFLDDKTKVSAVKVGSKTYTLDSLLNRNTIENVLTTNKKGEMFVNGTTKHDDIYVTDTTKFKDSSPVTISGNIGNDIIMIGSNEESELGNQDGYNVDPDKYHTVDITPTVYTHTKDGKQDKTLGVYEKVVSYASKDGTYYAQSAISDIKVYGDGTDDTYHAYYNNQFTKFYDESGVNDTLYINDKKSSDLKLIFTVSKNYKDWSTEISNIETITDENKATVVSLIGNSLQEVKLVTSDDRTYFLQNLDENNDVGIDIDYWGDKGLSKNSQATDPDAQALLALGKGKLAKFGDGIETIISSDNKYITSEDIAAVASEIASWLTEKGYADVAEVVTAEKTEGDLATLIGKFDNITWKDVPAQVQ